MDKNLTELVVVLDRSGSMSSCLDDAQKGLNHFISEQKKKEGRCNFTLVQFDDKIETVINGLDINSVGVVGLQPRGWTNLNDAIGKTIIDIGDRLKKLDERDRPGLVVFVIVTDGGHNVYSCEFNTERVKEMIAHQEEKYNWQFVYLGANQDAFAVAGAFGMQHNKVGNYNTNCFVPAFDSASKLTVKMRSASAGGACGQSMRGIGYDQEELDAMTDDTNKSN